MDDPMLFGFYFPLLIFFVFLAFGGFGQPAQKPLPKKARMAMFAGIIVAVGLGAGIITLLFTQKAPQPKVAIPIQAAP